MNPQEKGYIASLDLEELHALRNRVRCTWLRHEPLRFGSSSNRALLREARVTVDWRQTACGAASLRSPHYKKKRPRERSFLSFVGAAEEVVDGGSVEVGQFN